MAQTIDEILNEMDVAQAAQTELDGLNSPSQSAIYRLWKYITAVVMNLQQQMWDILKATIEKDISSAPPATPAWMANMILKFQSPGVAQLLEDFTIGYTVVTPELRIITQCAVVTIGDGRFVAKVAKDGVPLTLIELAALDSYIDLFTPAGLIPLNSISVDPDLVMVGANVTYNGQYSATISDSVKAAITNFLAAIPFNGILNISDLYVAIKNVAGVTDVQFTNVQIYASPLTPADATSLVVSGDWQITTVGTYSGNAIPDTASGRTLDDTLNFIVG